MGKLNLFVIILNYKHITETIECINSLKKAKNSSQWKIILVDNSPTKKDSNKASMLIDVKVLNSKENLGYSGGMNVGIKYALIKGADYILLLNNDMRVDENFLISILSGASQKQIVSPKIYFEKGYEFHKSRYQKQELGNVIWYAGGEIDWNNIIGKHEGVDQVDKGQFSSTVETEFATGACMLIPKHVLKAVGLFDEKYFLYLEDLDYSVRVKRAGFNITFEPKALSWHKNAGSTGGSGSELQDYFITRNRLLFAFKYANLKTKLAVLREAITKSNNKVKRMALFDFLKSDFGNGSYKIS